MYCHLIKVALQATDYFYTSGCRATPSFNYTFYTTWTTIVASIFGALGLVIFARLQHLPIKSIFAGLTCIKCFVATLEVLQAARWNIEIGISDETFYIAGDAIIGSVSCYFYVKHHLQYSNACIRRSLV